LKCFVLQAVDCETVNYSTFCRIAESASDGLLVLNVTAHCFIKIHSR